MRIGLDWDGVITSNFSHYFQLASDFTRSGHEVYIITAANRLRTPDIQSKLVKMDFPFLEIVERPIDFVSTTKNIGEWKKKILKKFDIDLWFENDVKFYEQAGVDFSDLKTAIVRI